MGWREFVASIVGSLAWPVAVVGLVALLRGHLGTLLTSTPLRRLKLGPGGAELEWDHAVVQVAADSVRALPAQDGLDGELDDLESLARRTPDAAMREAFALVERELLRVVERAKIELPADDRRPTTLIKAAYQSKAITKETGDALRGLVTLRDLAQRDPLRVSTEKAIDYLVLVRGVLYALGANRT